MKNAIMGIFLKKIKRDEKCHYGHFFKKNKKG